VRQGVVWVVRRADGAVLLERRPDKGLLGGTLGFPGTGWDGSDLPPPVQAAWEMAGTVQHTFTHFHLQLQVMSARADGPADRGVYLGANAWRPDDLTSLMRKAHDLALAGSARS
jgi:A/G-specific adenine glycosylase